MSGPMAYGQEFYTIWRRVYSTGRWVAVLSKKKQGREQFGTNTEQLQSGPKLGGGGGAHVPGDASRTAMLGVQPPPALGRAAVWVSLTPDQVYLLHSLPNTGEPNRRKIAQAL